MACILNWHMMLYNIHKLPVRVNISAMLTDPNKKSGDNRKEGNNRNVKSEKCGGTDTKKNRSIKLETNE